MLIVAKILLILDNHFVPLSLQNYIIKQSDNQVY